MSADQAVEIIRVLNEINTQLVIICALAGAILIGVFRK